MSTIKLSPSLKYRHVATIRWSHAFPFDMLRYDNCHPEKSDDVAEIFHRWSEDPKRTGLGPFKAHVVAYSETKAWPFTHDRWHSFGCNIEPKSIGELP